MNKFIIFAVLFSLAWQANGKTTLTADGSTDTYTLIGNVLGAAASQPEVPDCGHAGKHIYQGNDGQLNRQVFYFVVHKNEDDDRCINSDRQRVEFKTNKAALNGYEGETMSHSWNFKLDAGFQPSTAFTHIHQLKAVDGNDGMPLITLTPRKASTNKLQVIHVNNAGTTTHLAETNLAPLLGSWVHVVEESTYGTSGKYSLKLTKESDGSEILSVSKSNIEMHRDGASYYRGKWGIYRSLTDSGSLRDEQVRFDRVCIAKGSEKCT